MAVTLTLTDNVTQIDFTGAGSSRYSFIRDGLSLPLPEVRRVSGGEVLLSEGEQLVERRYGNREITITFKLRGTSHDDLIDAIRDLNRLLDLAKRVSTQAGFGDPVILRYKLDNATETVVFDVLDGEFTSESFANPLTRRVNLMLNCSLKLICRPFARAETPIEISNFLLNPSFDWNPGQGGRDGQHYITLGATTQKITVANTGLYPTGVGARMLLAGWIYVTSLPGTIMQIAKVGDAVNGVAYELYVDASNKLVFRWFDSTNAAHTLTSVTSLALNTWTFVAGLNFVSSVNGSGVPTDTNSLLFINDTVEATFHSATALTMDTPDSGTFIIGAKHDDTLRFQGRVSGFVVLKDVNILPARVRYLYLYGLTSLYSNTTAIMPHHYWGFTKAEIGGIWPFVSTDAGTQIDDKSGNARHLTIGGGAAKNTQPNRKPNGWTLGADFSSALVTGLDYVFKKFGLSSVRFFDTGSATRNLTQVVIPLTGQTDWSIWFWVRSAGATAVRLTLTDGAGTATHTLANTGSTWRQYIIKRAVSGNLTVGFEQVSGAAVLTSIDGVVVTSGLPFAEATTSLAEVTGTPKPFIGSRYLVNFPSTTKINQMEYRDIPGDVPATCRLYLKNTKAGPVSPVRIGLMQGREPWKVQFLWRASWLIPDFVSGSAYGSGINPHVSAGAAVTLGDKLRAGLAQLFPFPSDQVGSFKIYIGYESASALINLCRMGTKYGTFPLTGNPVQDSVGVSSNTHPVDGGLLSWPPASAGLDFRNESISGRPRDPNIMTPELTIANVAEAVIAAPGVMYRYLWLLPVEDGYIVQFPGSNNTYSTLQQDEYLVVDTIDRDAQTLAYVAKQIDSPLENTVHSLIASSDVSAFGPGFFLQPEKAGTFVAQTVGYDSSHFPFGKFTETDTMEMFLQYESRYLYV